MTTQRFKAQYKPMDILHIIALLLIISLVVATAYLEASRENSASQYIQKQLDLLRQDAYRNHSAISELDAKLDQHHQFTAKRFKTLAHDAQQIKAGDEWSKKREHAIMRKLGIKTLNDPDDS